ncbi:hypothetical protein AURDEDRAFT_112185 [Auricularia subglabra TFB-10046 SS5]|nr:hypothetical protein AURDEDRAFT_112185 [Auricularia subglabra TFB-10046 SS5]
MLARRSDRGACITPPPAPLCVDDQDGIGEPMMFEMSPIVASRGIEALATAMPIPVPSSLRHNSFAARAPRFTGRESKPRPAPVAVSPPFDGAVLDPVPALHARSHQVRAANVPPLQPAAPIVASPAMPRSVSSPYPQSTAANKPPSFRYQLPDFIRRHSSNVAAPVSITAEREGQQEPAVAAENEEVPDLVHHSFRCGQCAVAGAPHTHLAARIGETVRRRSSTPDAFKIEMLATQLALASSSEDDTPITPEHAVEDDDDDDDANVTVRARHRHPSPVSRGRNRSRRPLGRRSAPFMSELVLTSPSSNGGNDADRDADLSDTEPPRQPLRRRSG